MDPMNYQLIYFDFFKKYYKRYSQFRENLQYIICNIINLDNRTQLHRGLTIVFINVDNKTQVEE